MEIEQFKKKYVTWLKLIVVNELEKSINERNWHKEIANLIDVFEKDVEGVFKDGK
tara:strand:- start:1306 stop:1470 length:165 start_codon:yes stop_codon:yes gene_type:complete